MASNLISIDKEKSWQSQFKTGKNGIPEKYSIVNCVLILQNDPNLKNCIALDEFADIIIKIKDIPVINSNKGYWTEQDDASLRAYVEREYDLLFSKDIIGDSIIVVAKQQRINPVKDRIEKLKWDGKSRVATYFIDYLGAEDNEYTRGVTTAFLVGAIKRIYQPGCKFELVPILEGKQGLGKSTAVRILFPAKFNDSQAGLGRTKDDYQQLIGSWVIELAELSAMKRTDVEKTKNFISAQSDTYRGSYGHYNLPHPRQCVFIGSTNQSDYLKDETGERRFYPVKCGVNAPTKNVFKYDDVDVLQVLAEAKVLLENGQKVYLEPDLMKIAQGYQENAKSINPMKEAIEDFLEMQVSRNWDDLSMSLKRSYVRHMQNNDATKTSPEYLGAQLQEPFDVLNKTTIREILEVVFGLTTDKYLSGSRIQSESKKVKMIMDNQPDWKRKEKLQFRYGRKPGYVRM